MIRQILEDSDYAEDLIERVKKFYEMQVKALQKSREQKEAEKKAKENGEAPKEPEGKLEPTLNDEQ